MAGGNRAANKRSNPPSDVPLIINGALKDDDGCLILPLSTNEFFVAYDLGKIEMKQMISKSVATGKFVRSITNMWSSIESTMSMALTIA